MNEKHDGKSPEHVFCEHLLQTFQQITPLEFEALWTASTFGIHSNKGLRAPGYTELKIVSKLLERGLIQQDGTSPNMLRLTWLGMKLFGILDEEAYRIRRKG